MNEILILKWNFKNANSFLWHDTNCKGEMIEDNIAVNEQVNVKFNTTQRSGHMVSINTTSSSRQSSKWTTGVFDIADDFQTCM